MDKNLRGYLAELIGTFAVVFLSAGAVCVNQLAIRSGHEEMKLGAIGIALAYGLAYAAALAATLPFSNGYLNPAITLMFWVFKRLDGAKTMALIFVQLLGAALAGGLIRLAFAQEVLVYARLGSPHLNLQAFGAAGITPGVLLKGVAVELALTFLLTFFIFATIMDPRVHKLLGVMGKRLIGLWVGMLLTAITLVSTLWTGAAVNPARWFGTVVWEFTVEALRLQKPFDDHMVYWFGPIAGALLGGVVYTLLFLSADSEQVPATTMAGTKAATGAGATLFRSKK